MFFMICLILFVLGILCIIYDVLLIVFIPRTFLDNLTAFSHIWSFFGFLLIFTSVYKKKKGYFFWKKWKKVIKRIIVIFMGIAVIYSLVSIIFILNPKIAKEDEHYDYLIILGGGIDKNGKLPKAVQLRIEKAVEYLKNNKDTLCVVSGGCLKWLPYAEAPEIKRQVVLKGISSERVILEDKSLDTIQNLENTCKLLAEKEGKSQKEILESDILIVTSDYHLRRAQRIARRLGFTNCKGISSKTPFFYKAHSYLREICAYLKLNMRILLTGKPDAIA